jgi:hypothetical protein
MSEVDVTGLELAFSFAAASFLEEELEEIKYELGFPDFLDKGKYVRNEAVSGHKHEWWARPEDIEALNNFYAEQKVKAAEKDGTK